MSCTHCERAKADPSCILGSRDCKGCVARCLANLGSHVESEERGAITPDYRATLERLYGNAWALGHEKVKEWAGRLRAVAAAAKTGAAS